MKSRSVGTKLMINNVKVGSLTSITGVEVSAETTEVTALDNQDGYREYLGGYKDGGEVPIEGYLDGADEGQTEMYEALEDQQVHDFQIVFPEAIGKTWIFKGVVTKFATAAVLQDAIKYSGSIKVSGKPTLGATSEQAKTEQTTTEEG